MTLDISIAWTKVEQLITGLIAMLPNLVLALLLFSVFFAGSRWIKFFILKISSARGHGDVGLVLGRLSHWTLISLSLLVVLTIVLPSFHGKDLIPFTIKLRKSTATEPGKGLGWAAGSNGIPRPRKLADALVNLTRASCVKVQGAR